MQGSLIALAIIAQAVALLCAFMAMREDRKRMEAIDRRLDTLAARLRGVSR